ncbi:MAG: hypothetical protein LBS21_05980 [Clostridiales bacterium]|jgi:hypothetical protein|nr:hypothetical protein [Clostridiales bacterium]
MDKRAENPNTEANASIQALFNFSRNFLNSTHILDEKTKKLLLHVASKPIEQSIYDGVISTLPVNASYEENLNAAAELYYLQNRLNVKIGKITYPYGKKDAILVYYIFCEMRRRRKEELKDYEDSPADGAISAEEAKLRKKRRELFEYDAFERFLDRYPHLNDEYDFLSGADIINSIVEKCRQQPALRSSEIMGVIKSGGKPDSDAEPEEDYYSLMLEYTKMRNWAKSPKSIYCVACGLGRPNKFDTDPPTLKELYIFGVACGLNREQFDKLYASVLKTAKGIKEKNYIHSGGSDDICKTFYKIFNDIEAWIVRLPKIEEIYDENGNNIEKKMLREMPKLLYGLVHKFFLEEKNIDLRTVKID